jgi:hypothetical protein
MPDKQNENKFMAMLERRGIVRKADSEDNNVVEAAPVDTRSRPDTDLRSIFNVPDNNPVKTTPAARQPVPGMPTPVFPSEQPQQLDRMQPPTFERAEREQREQPEPVKPLDIEQPKPAEPVEFQPVAREKPEKADITIPSSIFGSIEPFKDDVPQTMEQTTAPAALADPYTYEEPPEPPGPPPIESYTDRYLDVEDLYEVMALRAKRTDTIYLIEEYIKTLPDSLPDQSRREIISKLVVASGFDYDILMGDGVLRVKMLKDYAERFAQYTDDYVSARHSELDELEQQILRIRRLIENRRDLHKKQFFAIEAEAQRLKEILTFISG